MKAQSSGTKPKRYPSDLTRTQWKRLKRLLPEARPGGRPRSVDLPEVLNYIFYIARGGGAPRVMPRGLPPPGIYYAHLRRGGNDGHRARAKDLLPPHAPPPH